MALDIAVKAEGLVQQVEGLSVQVLAAVGGNNSANKRARKMTVLIREQMKVLRKELLQLEKDRK
tara:strand:+ start:209 stop:400 length:192 start_codon:yes stop_codon:yes gene_type:complete